MTDAATLFSAANPLTAGALERRIGKATKALLDMQRPDGHWVFELEADATIPAEYVLFVHYFGEQADLELERKIGVYLRRIQGEHGGWPLFKDGAFDMSASVKAYFALKMIGDDIDAPHMKRAREAIRSRGGAIHSNVFTRCLLSLYGVMTWRSVPVMPVEIMLLPGWFPFHLMKISYWARTVIVPLLVLQAEKPQAKNPRGVGIDELFLQPPRSIGAPHRAPHQKRSWFTFFAVVDAVLRAAEPLLARLPTRRRAYAAAVDFVRERLNGEDGLGAIYPAMANSVMMFDVLGMRDHPDRAVARKSVEKLVTVHEHEAYVQPCLSPVWDTALMCHALLETGEEDAAKAAEKGLDWLEPLQVLDVKGDWAYRRPDVRPGGWAFQYANPHYPDLDDTAVVVLAMDRVRKGDTSRFRDSIDRAREWIEGLQSRNGGWGAFDADNIYEYLNNIPFADHGALLDPPSPDLTGRCLSMLGQLGERADNPAIARGIDYLRQDQLADGSWYGRWGLNYIYGTWSAGRQGEGLADLRAESGRRLGRGRLQLQAGLSGNRAGALDCVTNGMGLAWIDGGRRGGSSVGRAGRELSCRGAGRRWALERRALHCDRIPTRLLSPLSRLFEVLPSLGYGALSCPQKRQQPRRRSRIVTMRPQGPKGSRGLMGCRTGNS
jgi:squalene-hopene/tetraprenyl-beta-curcumene cyclase